jgi:catecholate siderophore receptor
MTGIISRRSTVQASSVGVGLGMLAVGLPALGVAQETTVSSAEVRAAVAPRAPALGKLTSPLVDTPQTITILTRQDLDDRGVNTLNDALRNVPGISLGAGETSFQGNNVILRGFTTRNDMFLDGMRDYGYYYRDPFNDESIEVLKGPASILFGRGSTGGVIHQVSKTPSQGAFTTATAVVGTDETRRFTADLNAPVGGAYLRLNAMAHQSTVADRDGGETRRWGLAPSVAFGLGGQTQFYLSYLHQAEDNIPDYGIPWFNGRPAAVDRANYYGFDTDYLDTRVNIATARVEHAVSDQIQVRSQLRYSHNTRKFRTSEGVVPAGVPVTTPLSAITLTRNEFTGFSTDEFLQNQTDMTARFATGSVRHTLVAGVELGREEPRPTYIFNTGVPTTNLANPPSQTYAGTGYVRLRARTKANTAGLYALDTLVFSDALQAMLGVRWDQFKAHYRSTGFTPAGAVAAATDVEQADEAPSYRGALIYKPAPNASLYAGYSTSFNPSAEGIESLVSAGRSVAQANLNLGPEKSRTYEAGGKWSLAGGQVLLSGAAFKIEKTNVRIPNPTVPGFNALGGDQRVSGAEVEAVGRITAAWSVRAGYTYLDSKVSKTAPGGPVLGAPLTLTPKRSFTVWSTYALTPRFEIGGGALSMSSRLGQNTAAAYLTAPGFTTFDAMAKYALTPELDLQLNLYNLTDKLYYDQLHPFHIVPGAGRSALLTITLHR